jgi:hypothetical protein
MLCVWDYNIGIEDKNLTLVSWTAFSLHPNIVSALFGENHFVKLNLLWFCSIVIR